MGPRLLCFAGGAGLTAFFVFLGLLATPFFGSGAFLWANVFAGFLLSLAAGHVLGDLLARLFGPRELKLAAPRLAVAGGAGAYLAAYYLPEVCRHILAGDPDWTFAPAAAIVSIAIVPGALLAAIVPSELRVRLDDCDAQTMAKSALRLLGLMIMGGVVGIILCAKPVLRADEVDVYLYAYITGALMILLGSAFMGLVGRVVSVALLGCCIALTAARPSEIQSEPFAVALESTWKQGRGGSTYYRRTAVDTLLTAEQLRLQTKATQEGKEKPGIILTCEMLMALGPVTVSGEGLRRTLDLLLQPQAKPFVMPFFDNLDAIRSDGRGLLYCTIKRQRGKQGVKFSLPGKEPGEKVELWYRDDFTIHLIRSGPIWKMEIGPLTTVHAGIFDLNDTKLTPVRLPNVKLWVDASLLGLIIEDTDEKLALRVVAQGEIGGVKTEEVLTTYKDAQGRLIGDKPPANEK